MEDMTQQPPNKPSSWLRKLLSYLAVAVITAAITAGAVWGFGTFMRDVYGARLIRESESTPRITLSADEYLEENDVHLTAESLSEWKSSLDKYRSSIMYNTLTENEKMIYRAMEYAMEADLPYICVSHHLVSDRETLIKVLRHLALDSPLLEQNLRYGTKDFSTTYPISIIGWFNVYAEMKGYYIRVDNFTSELRTGRMAALDKAKELVAALPKEADTEERAELLFRQIALGAEYYDYPATENRKVHPYLYDALLEGRANCDGYTNALALVYRLAGIECVEKNFVSEEEGVDGHTWLCFQLGDKWYNADGTGDSLIPKTVKAMHAGFYYGFSDILQKHHPLYAESYPVCSESLYIPIDAHLPTAFDARLSDTVLEAFRKHDGQWALVLLDSWNDTAVKQGMQTVANTLHSKIYRRKIKLVDGRYALLVYIRL